jgi:hypothetical protein
VKVSECVVVPLERQEERLPEYVENLVWLQPQDDLTGYEAMREELARGDGAFKLPGADL